MCVSCRSLKDILLDPRFSGSFFPPRKASDPFLRISMTVDVVHFDIVFAIDIFHGRNEPVHDLNVVIEYGARIRILIVEFGQTDCLDVSIVLCKSILLTAEVDIDRALWTFCLKHVHLESIFAEFLENFHVFRKGPRNTFCVV